MSTRSDGHGRLLYNKQGLINGLIVCLIMAGLLLALFLPKSIVRESGRLDYFWLALLIDFVFALWIAWSMPTVRVICLAAVGALAGVCTEFTARWAGLWKYERDCLKDGQCLSRFQELLRPFDVARSATGTGAGTGIGIEAGILIYMLTAIALFGLVYTLNRMLLRAPLMRSSGWANPIFVFLVFLGLWATVPDTYLDAVRTSLSVQIYYGVLFIFAATFSYCMRKATVLAIIVGAGLVSFVGQYTGGSLAGIWVFRDWEVWSWLPGNPYPPVFLIVGIWPLEYLVEYGLSSLLADFILAKTRAKPILEFQAPASSGAGQEQVRIDYLNTKGRWLWPDMKSMVEFSRRSFLRMLRRSPEVGEVITALAGLFLAVFASYGFGFQKFHLWQAAGVALLFGAALLTAPKMFVKRVAGFAFFGFVAGASLMTGADLARSPLNGSFGLFWGVLAFLVCMTIYGISYLIIRKIVLVFHWKGQMKDKGEPSSAVAGAAVVLMLLLIVIHFLLPVLFNIGIVNPAYFLFLLAVIVAFVFWWFYFVMPVFRSVIHTLVAVLVIAGVLWLIPLAPEDGQRFAPFFQLHWLKGTVSHLTAVWLACGIGLWLSYLFAYTASANLAGESLSKGIRVTYHRRPHMTEKEDWIVRFHDSPHPGGIRRKRETEGGASVLHTYPAAISGVCVAAADPVPIEGKPGSKIEPTVEKTLDTVLDRLQGQWATYDSQGRPIGVTESLKEALAGRTVFIKPNLVAPVGSPYTTQAELVAALARYCRRAKAKKIIIGEIPISNITSEMTLVATGLKDYWESLNEETDEPPIEVLLLDERPFRRITLQDDPKNRVPGVVFSDFSVPADMLDERVFYINVPKMKTHLQSSVTLGIKNSHGLVPECQRGARHEMISQKVVDITKVWTPDLTIVDGYDGLEGIGPWPGDRVASRVLIASNDVVLADLTATQLMGKEEQDDERLDFSRPVRFHRKFVKTTWLGFEQGLGLVDPNAVRRTWHPGPDVYPTWKGFKQAHFLDFRRPEYRDEGLIKNIGSRFGRMPHFPECEPDFPDGGVIPHAWNYAREFLPLSGNDPVVGGPKVLEATRTWGPVRLVADDFENPDLGASVMMSGVFGLLKELLEKYFSRELGILDGFVIVYGPLLMPLECEGAILFGDRAIETDFMVFAPRIFQVPGFGHPPNNYSDIFERIAQEMRGRLIGYTTEVITFARGWYW